MAFDFPTGAAVDQIYTSPDGVTYTWDGEKWMRGGATTGGGGEFVLKTGDTMSGPLTLPGDPTAPLHATPKQYVDARSLPPAGLDGQALVSKTGVPVWGSPVNGGIF